MQQCRFHPFVGGAAFCSSYPMRNRLFVSCHAYSILSWYLVWGIHRTYRSVNRARWLTGYKTSVWNVVINYRAANALLFSSQCGARVQKLRCRRFYQTVDLTLIDSGKLTKIKWFIYLRVLRNYSVVHLKRSAKNTSKSEP